MRSTVVAWILVGLLAGCGGGGSEGGSLNSTPETSLAGPIKLTSALGPGPDDITLTWEEPVNQVAGYLIEAKVGSEDFQMINTPANLIPRGSNTIFVTFNSSAPDGTDYIFRVRAVRGTVYSPYSNESVYTRILKPAMNVQGAYDWTNHGVMLNWSKNSSTSTSFAIQRAECASNGALIGPWVELKVLDPSAQSYFDPSTAFSTYYLYKVTNFKNAISSVESMPSRPVSTCVAPPTWILSSYDFLARGMVLTWDRGITITSYSIQRAECDVNGTEFGPWLSLVVSDPKVSTYVDQTVSMNIYYAYRVTNISGSVSSVPGPVSTPAYAGLLPPKLINANFVSSPEGISISWTNSNQANGILLERAVANEWGSPVGGWIQLSVPAGLQSSYLDQNVQEITYYIYRASSRRDLVTSAPCNPTQPVAPPLRVPVAFTATVAPGGIQLTWQNRSTTATKVVVNRNQYDKAVLGPNATTYLDPSPPLGFYTYRLLVTSGTWQSWGPWVDISTPNPQDSLSLTATPLSFSNVWDAALQANGSWALAVFPPFGIPSFNDPWPAYFPDNLSRVSSPLIQMDGQGRPHMVYLAIDPQDAQNFLLTHAWFDGSKWKNEEMGRTNIPFGSSLSCFTYTLDGSGTPQALLDHATPDNPNGGLSSTLTYVRKVSGVWTPQSLAWLDSSISRIETYKIQVDDKDIPHLLLGLQDRIVECTKDAQGNWMSTVLPTGAVRAYSNDFLDGAWKDANSANVFFERTDLPASIGYRLMVIQKIGGVWQPPIQLDFRDSSDINTPRIVLSADRSRVGIIRLMENGLLVHNLDGNGWHQTLVCSTYDGAGAPLARVGIDASNKFHILFSKWPNQYTDYHE